MSKQFIVDRHTTPGTPALDAVATAKVPIYDTMADVIADLANLTVGQIVATKDTGDELAQPVNVVEEGNLHAVSSNAVYEFTREELLWENANINTNFASTTLTSQDLGKDLSQYRAIEVYARNIVGGGNYSYSKIPKDLPVTITAVASSILSRKITFENTGITIGVGYNVATYASSSSTDNSAIIPYKIFGIR